MKQFSKFKQFADKAFVRPDRTEVMSEDLLEADRHIELMKQTCETTVKKMAACVQIPSQNKEGTTIARRIKKVPEFALGSNLDELGKKFDDTSILGVILGEAGKIEMTIGTQMMAHDGKIETIMGDLQKLLDNDFPNIYKSKRSLAKLAENMDTAKAKLQQANRHSMGTTTGGKVDNCKDELDESQQKVEQCRDTLASEMYQLLSRETDIAQSIVQFLKYQLEYHKCISNTLSNLLPEVDAALANSSNKPVYGTDLTEHLTASGRSIAYPLELCVCGLLETALKEEGLFRIAGSASKVKKLKSAFNAWLVDLKGLMGEFSDPHVIGNALKCYLRELPNPLLTLELYGDWIEAIRISDNQEKLQSLWSLVQKLPPGNRENLRYLIKFLRKLSDHQEVNKMSSANIAIVLGPNLLWSPSLADDSPGDSTPMGLNMAMTHWYSSIVEQLVTYADWFFPGELEFFVTCEKPEPEWVSVNLLRKSPVPGTIQQSSLANGGGTDDALDDNQLLKRSQSNSSLDEHLTHNGSPKPVIRRKVKPAPLPPTNVIPKSSEVTPTLNESVKPQPTYQSQLPKTTDAGKRPIAATKREGMWIPPSPSQMNTNRVSYFSQNQQAPPPPYSATSTPLVNPPTAKVVPPKPPQPSFLKDKPSGAEPTPTTTSNLRHKSSFRSPSKLDSKDGTEASTTQITTGSTALQYSASLPRHFHTENSYKNASPSHKAKAPPVNAFTVKTETLAEPQQPLLSTFSTGSGVSMTKEISTENMKQESLPQDIKKEITTISPVHKNDSGQQTQETSLLIGFDSIEAELSSVTEVESKLVSSGPPNVMTEQSRPVPAPRSSLLKDLTALESKLQSSLKERPSVKAKPRDLGKRAHGDGQSFQSHSRNSSGSGQDSEAEVIVPDAKGSTPTSQPHSRTHSRMDSNAEEKKFSDGISQQIEGKSSAPSEDELGNESQGSFGGAKNSPRMPYRPPRPHPPLPPNKGKSGENTEF